LARESDLETALLNLLDNAQRFSPDGQAVSLVVSGPGEDGMVVLRVTDLGPGILAEHVPRVFDRFFTTDAERDGTGLGLAIVKSARRSGFVRERARPNLLRAAGAERLSPRK
jgi:two-component system, OmpR family, sensor histidine kinase ChvG